jgi:predicted Zn-dependent peptidase
MKKIQEKLNRSLLVTLCLGAFVALACAKTPEEAIAPEPVAPAAEPVAEVKEPEREYPEPPQAGDPKPVNFPDYQKFEVKNGLKVFVVENHEVPIVSAQLVIKAGTMDDQHVADFTANMLGEGTKSRSKARIDAAIEQVGGRLSAGAGTHTTTIRARVLKKDVRLALTLMADEVMNPIFPEEALEKQKNQAKTALEAAKAQPGPLAGTLFGMVAYPEGHPYGRPFPTEEEIDAVKVDDLKKFHETFYRANNAFLILSGDVTKETAEPVVTRALGRWKAVDPKELPANPLNDFTSYELPDKLVVHLVDRPASAQAEIIVGNLCIARNHQDWIKLQVTNTLLGGAADGRLFLDIREERGLTYGIYSGVSQMQAPGTFRISTRTKTKTTGEMMRAIFEHVRKIRATEPEDKEFNTVVKKLVGKFPLEIETAREVAGKVRTTLVYNLPNDYWKTYRDEVAKVSRADVKTIARKYIHSVPHVVIVGKAKKIQKQLKEVLPSAEILLYDTELKPKQQGKK